MNNWVDRRMQAAYDAAERAKAEGDPYVRVPHAFYSLLTSTQKDSLLRGMALRGVTMYVDPEVRSPVPGAPPPFSTYGVHASP